MATCSNFNITRLFRLMASLFAPAASTSSTSPPPGGGIPGNSLAIPKEPSTLIHHWVQLVNSHLAPWDTEGEVAWSDLVGFQLQKAYHYKSPTGAVAHEFIICEFWYNGNKENSLLLQLERMASQRTDSDSSISTFSLSSRASATNPAEPNPRTTAPQPVAGRRSSRFFRRFASLPGSRNSSEASIPRSCGISSAIYLADDIVHKIKELPGAQVIKTVTFSKEKRPCLWDVMILADFVHKKNLMYHVINYQCFWFADTCHYILEKWAEVFESGRVNTVKPDLAGTIYALTRKIYKRPEMEDMQLIWDDFLQEKERLGNMVSVPVNILSDADSRDNPACTIPEGKGR